MADIGEYDFPCRVRGDTYAATRVGPILSDGVPLGLDGATVRMHVRRKSERRRDACLVLELSTDDGSIIVELDPVDGDTIRINEFVIDQAGDFEYSIEITFPGDVVRTWVRGLIPILEDPTHG